MTADDLLKTLQALFPQANVRVIPTDQPNVDVTLFVSNKRLDK